MSTEIHYDREQNILHIVVQDVITVADFGDLLELITHGEEYPPDVPALWDLCEIDAREADPGMIDNLIAIRQRYPERGNTRLALLTSSDLAFGLSRMYEALSADLPQLIRVFKDRATAEQWLQEQDTS